MKAYITKYALSGGIFEATGVLSENNSDFFRIVGDYNYYTKKEWYQSFEDAVADAETRRTRKIASLKKQIAKLEKMTFDKAKPWT